MAVAGVVRNRRARLIVEATLSKENLAFVRYPNYNSATTFYGRYFDKGRITNENRNEKIDEVPGQEVQSTGQKGQEEVVSAFPAPGSLPGAVCSPPAH